jgi:hypothetical protein
MFSEKEQSHSRAELMRVNMDEAKTLFKAGEHTWRK